MKIAIVGAGMAGLACAEALAAQSAEITLFDKGGRPGGRMSTRITATPDGVARFDHGATRFQARDVGFRARLEIWRAAGLVARWPGVAQAQIGDESWVGVPGMSAPLAAMAEAFTVRWRARIESLARRDGRWHLGGDGVAAPGVEAVVVAVPPEQVVPLLAAHDASLATVAGAARSEPCWTLMAIFSTRLPIEADLIVRAGDIQVATRETSKADRSGPEAWVIQASARWSREHLEDDRATIAGALLERFASATRVTLPGVLSALAHRWRYARPAEASPGRSGEGFLWNAALGLGICGDWLVGSDVESAWRSGTALGRRICGDG